MSKKCRRRFGVEKKAQIVRRHLAAVLEPLKADSSFHVKQDVVARCAIGLGDRLKSFKRGVEIAACA